MLQDGLLAIEAGRDDELQLAVCRHTLPRAKRGGHQLQVTLLAGLLVETAQLTNVHFTLEVSDEVEAMHQGVVSARDLFHGKGDDIEGA